MANGGVVGGLQSLGEMSGQMVDALNTVVYGGSQGGGMPSSQWHRWPDVIWRWFWWRSDACAVTAELLRCLPAPPPALQSRSFHLLRRHIGAARLNFQIVYP